LVLSERRITANHKTSNSQSIMKTPDSAHTVRTGLLAALLLAIGATAQSAEPTASLKDAFKDYFKVGTAISAASRPGMASDGARRKSPKDIALVKAQFNQIVPENEMKWMSVHPRPGKDGYDWTAADAFAEFGSKNNMELAGHTLVWHSQTPNWVFEGTSLPPGAKAGIQAGWRRKESRPKSSDAAAGRRYSTRRAASSSRWTVWRRWAVSAGSISMDLALPVKNCSKECGSTFTRWSVATKGR
jgi:hypothetical protein